MAIGYVPLPAAQVPRNAMLDLSGYSDAIDTYSRRKRENAMMEYRRERDAADDKRADERMGMERSRFGMQQETFNQAKKDRATKALAGTAQMILSAPPEQQASMWQRVRQTVRDMDADLAAIGIDPNDHQTALQAIVARARGPIDPLEQQKTQAEINLRNSQSRYYDAQSEAKATAAARPARGTPDPRVTQNLAAGLDRLATIPNDMGQWSFEASTGAFQGGDGYILTPISRAWGSLLNATAEHSTTEVRNRIQGDTLALATALKPLIRQPGEGIWTDKDQELLNTIVGNLQQSNSVEEFYRNLDGVRERIRANFGIDLPEINDGPPKIQGQLPQEGQTQTGQPEVKQLGGKTYVKINGQWFEQ